MRLSDGVEMKGAGSDVGGVAMNVVAFVIDRRSSKQTPSSSVVESDSGLENLLLSCVGSLCIRHSIHNRHSLHPNQLLEIDDSRFIPIRVLETSNEIRSIRITGKESTGGGGRRRVNVDEDRMFGRLDNRVGVFPQSMSMREQRTIPIESILRNVEYHLSRATVRRDGLESGDEIFLYTPNSDYSSRFLSDSEVDKGDILVEEVERGIEAGFSKGSRASEEIRKGRFGRGSAGRWLEGDAVDQLGGDIESVFLLVVSEDTARCEGEERFGSSRECIFRNKGLESENQLDVPR